MQARSLADYEHDTIEILRELTQDWDSDFDDELSPTTAIAADLEFDSLDVVHLIAAIQQRYQRQDFPFEALLMIDGRYVPDLTVTQIAQFVQRHEKAS